ncbi:Aminoglycoside phosphotransferase [Penicillium coprophilum]|uniref:Aminoglycoside phosphotransferase n=1 Tax=Penicillium coprophilum TaxID=36646 RepID=UPI00239DAB14|nr:Aminoglycoside phosphotransferase [Penicillium coprophilum]KAJ5155011.1 Aminoglycoside phosphotransferase [Penicillium coprophilum]
MSQAQKTDSTRWRMRDEDGKHTWHHLDDDEAVAKWSQTLVDKSIGREELFAYTNGRFLVDEKNQLDRRYVKFDLDALCSTAAAVGGQLSQITAIEKMEGGFSKVLLMQKENGMELIAKIPCRIAGPAVLTTECEVGVLEFLRKHTGFPVPRVLSWSSDRSNAVGAQYIIMEKASGVQLYEVWGKMSDFDKLQLIRNLTKLEAQLSAIRFPAYGGLYLQKETNILKSIPLDKDIDPTGSFCIGPSCDRTYQTEEIGSDVPRGYDIGPWNTISALGISIARRELSRISTGHHPSHAHFYNGSVEEQTHLLETTIRLMLLWDTNSILSRSSQPTLWHTDLHMGNIYVSPDEHSRIVSFIDLQGVLVLPAFLQARWPVFLNPAKEDEYVKGLIQPKLPDNFNQLDEGEKRAASSEWEQDMRAKAYEVATYLENRPAYTAMIVPRVFRELFIRCGETSEMGVLPLRECLIEIFHSWSDLGFTGDCPFSFTKEEIETHQSQFADYQDWHQVQAIARECLETDAEGWISPHRDFEYIRTANQQLQGMYIQQMAGKKSPEEAKAIWPFPV